MTKPTPPTERAGKFTELHTMSVEELTSAMHEVDFETLKAVGEVKESINSFISQLVLRMKKGGRLFYMGAGTSGRLGVVDASECPPTFGVNPGVVVGIIAGGDSAIRQAVEGAEDDSEMGWLDLNEYNVTGLDSVVGIAASGRTPYVIGAIKSARDHGLLTACITCNPDTELAEVSEFPIEVITGPEFVTGSTRLKAGTATKLVLNMISTIAMIQLGHVKGSKMVDMQLSNAKLIERGTYMVMEATGLAEVEARELLIAEGSVREAVDHYNSSKKG
ncbi:MAG TPA: N-acetylmuramic acid 6-phosphate etherase [Flavobacteriales bacterium]|nr:N-acetylmuramic acid 6-phosphate etherase [Flavobacteriales bacterium]HIB76200.1 N-acetylmuramic acid 6-phosphate etherase [Flavobacteriales bacterium]HIO15744.1 N-acetylmuramic acid 6-phosphate etherase [Flavobacteriales bacterium]HIO59701.1 N-acetylmuramic acid 6-phosphate etherase [Flavobacteriales bacterium]